MIYQKLQKICSPVKSLDDYLEFTPITVNYIRKLAKPLKGLKIVHINATASGGGVAEMLKPEVALQNDIGLLSSAYVIPPNTQFFEITKKIHNFLQGQPCRLSATEKTVYLQHNRLIGRCLSNLNPPPDLIIIHDPQPLSSVSFVSGAQPLTLWRCHIDTTSPNKNGSR